MVITGVIRPPPEIRAVADRTALYVAKNGRAFEARILKSEKAKTPKFAFLQPTSPFHAYYEDRIQFYEAGGEDGDDNDTNNKKEGAEKKENTTAAPKETTTVRKTEKTQKASAIDPIAKALLGQRNKIQQARAKQKEESKEGGENGGGTETTTPSSMPLPPPPPLELVTIVAPSNLSVVQIETIQLVAQFAAMDGKGGPFLQQLTLREWTNTAFSFCQPRHAHFAYFSALVDAYRRILGQWTTAAANFKSMESSGTPPLLDVQASLQEAAYRAEYERELLQMKSQQEEGEVVAIDWQDFVVVETIDFPVDEKVELSMLPPPPPPKIQEQPPSVAAAKTEQHEGMEESDDDEDEEETIRVVPSYTPKVVGTANPLQARAIDPITGKSVSVADMPEHMRIQLMDPKWAEERKKFQEKQKDSNLVSGDAIASNISRFAQARGDLFGKSEQELLSKEKDSKKRLEEANRIIREQTFQQTGQPVASAGAAGSSVKTGAPAMDPSMVPAAKRARVDNVTLPPPPPPMAGAIPVTRAVAPPVSAPAPAGEPQLSGDPMTDAGDMENDGMESKLIPAAEFAASLSKPDVTLQIRIPNDPSQMAWNFYGQILSMSVNVMSKVKTIKEELSRMHLNGMPANKIQFKATTTGFLKDNLTLADLNIGPSATVELIPKTRGGRK